HRVHVSSFPLVQPEKADYGSNAYVHNEVEHTHKLLEAVALRSTHSAYAVINFCKNARVLLSENASVSSNLLAMSPIPFNMIRFPSERPVRRHGSRPRFVFEGVSETQAEDEDHKANRADREQRVPWHAQPAQGLHEALAEELVAAGIPVTVFD